MATNHDYFVTTMVKDMSIALPDPEPIQTGLVYLQPFFSPKGLDNEIKRYSGVGAFDLEYGTDASDIRKYSHGALIAREVLKGGGIVDCCRLMPVSAKQAGIAWGIKVVYSSTDRKTPLRISQYTADYDKELSPANWYKKQVLIVDRSKAQKGEKGVELPTKRWSANTLFLRDEIAQVSTSNGNDRFYKLDAISNAVVPGTPGSERIWSLINGTGAAVTYNPAVPFYEEGTIVLGADQKYFNCLRDTYTEDADTGDKILVSDYVGPPDEAEENEFWELIEIKIFNAEGVTGMGHEDIRPIYEEQEILDPETGDPTGDYEQVQVGTETIWVPNEVNWDKLVEGPAPFGPGSYVSSGGNTYKANQWATWIPTTSAVSIWKELDPVNLRVVVKYPILWASLKGRGTYGNDYQISVSTDIPRLNTHDGIRYGVRFYENGVIVGSSFEYLTTSFDSESTLAPGSPIKDCYDINFEAFQRTYKLPIDSGYSSENYIDLLSDLALSFPIEDRDRLKYFIDPVGGATPRDYNYDDPAPTNVLRINRLVLTGGEEIRHRFTGGTDGRYDYNMTTGEVLDERLFVNGVVRGLRSDEQGALAEWDCSRRDGADPEAHNPTQLLENFYRGNVDASIYDHRIIDSGISLDAWWPFYVKNIMTSFFNSDIRDDITTIVDLGPDVYTAKDAAKNARRISVGSHDGLTNSVAITIHNGTTLKLPRNVRTSSTFEIAGSLPALYRSRGPFTVYAGYMSGRVNNMRFDFYPRVIKDDVEIGPLRDASLLFAMRLDRTDNLYWMSDDSQYANRYSVLGSLRNVIFVGEVIRTFRKVLVRYSFHPVNAAAAIADARADLNATLTSGFFPPSLPITYDIFQTKNDKITQNATVTINITFPDTIKTWTCTINAHRQPLE